MHSVADCSLTVNIHITSDKKLQLKAVNVINQY